MHAFRLILGLGFLIAGLLHIVGRDRIHARGVGRQGRLAQSPMLWLVLGSMFVLIGLCWLASAIV
jgi:hypothetical protein